MTRNDILRRLRYALQIDDSQVAEAMALTGVDASTGQVVSWLKREEDEGYSDLSEEMLRRFLDGLIIQRRGTRSDGSTPQPPQFLSNNEILKKLRIALELRDDDMNAVFELADFVVTKAELSSFFRKDGHRNFRKCPEQVLRKFIQGLGRRLEQSGSN